MIILVFIYSSYSTNLYRMPHIWTLRAKYWRHRKLWTGGMAQEAIIPCGKGQSRKVWVCLMWSVRSDLQPQWDSRSAHHNRASSACPSLLQLDLTWGPLCSCFRTMNSKREAGVKVKYHDCCNVRSLRHMCVSGVWGRPLPQWLQPVHMGHRAVEHLQGDLCEHAGQLWRGGANPKSEVRPSREARAPPPPEFSCASLNLPSPQVSWVKLSSALLLGSLGFMGSSEKICFQQRFVTSAFWFLEVLLHCALARKKLCSECELD